MRMRSFVTLGAALLALGTSAHAATSFDFETAGQYANNFRKIAGPGVGTQTGPSAGNDYVALTAPSNFVSVYDATPADAGQKNVFAVSQGSPVTVSADLTFNSGTSSFGVYFVDPTDESKGYLALLNFNQSGTNELIRFSTDASPSTNGAGTLTNGSPAATDIVTGFVPTTATFSYALDASNHPVLSVTVGSFTSSATFPSVASPLTSVELALRDSAQNSGENDFDNVVLPDSTVVPEPTSLAMLGLGVGGLLLRRRGRRTVG